jgi:hypothetical protein
MFDRAKRTGEANTFDMNKNTGITTWTDKHGNTVVTDRYGNMISESSASASRADSASSANSQNTVKCLAFCLGISTANSGSAANSDSRTNSPGSTVTAQPVEPRTSTAAAPDFSNPPPLSTLFPSTPKPNSFDKNNALTVFNVLTILVRLGMKDMAKDILMDRQISVSKMSLITRYIHFIQLHTSRVTRMDTKQDLMMHG